VNNLKNVNNRETILFHDTVCEMWKQLEIKAFDRKNYCGTLIERQRNDSFDQTEEQMYI